MAKQATDADFRLMQEGIGEQKTPSAALTKLAAALRLYGYAQMPKISVVTHPEYGKLTIYEFVKTPFGTLVLTTGQSVWPTLEREQDMPIASGVSARFAVAAAPLDLSPAQHAAIARSERLAGRAARVWEEAPPDRSHVGHRGRPVMAPVIPAAPAAAVVEEEEIIAEPARRRGRPPGSGKAAAAQAAAQAASAAAQAAHAAAAVAAEEEHVPAPVAAPVASSGEVSDAEALATLQALIGRMG